MEQNPIVGYVKAFVFAVLAFTIFLVVWQGDKTEDKITKLDRTVEELDKTVSDLRGDLRGQKQHMDRLAGANETLLKMLAAGGVRAVEKASTGGNGGEVIDLMSDKPKDWGAHLNAGLDAKPDPSKPVGTPGRYKNFQKPDPAGWQAPENPGNTNGEIRLGWSSEPKGFNFMVETYNTLTVECQVYCLDAASVRHWKRPSSFNWAPSLCWRIEVSPDYKEYTLFFRRDAYWHEPLVDLREYPHLRGKHKVTAKDQKFALDLIKNQQTKLAHLRSYYEEMDSVELIDDYTLVIRWKDTVFNSLAWSMAPYIMPYFLYGYDENGNEYPEETVGQEFNDHWYDRLKVGPVGCGPYRFVKYEKGKYVRMERWDDWYGFKDNPLYPVKVRHLKIYNEAKTTMSWLRAGEIDLTGMRSTEYRNWVLEETDPKSPFKDGRIHTYVAPSTAYLFLAWKNTDPLFNDKRVRQALTYACDRAWICKEIFINRYEPMAAPVYPYSEESTPGLKPYPYDLEKAKRLLDEAGWLYNQNTGLREKVINGETTPFVFKLHWPGPAPEFQAALDHFKNDLLKIGIKMEPQSMQWAVYQKEQSDRKYRAFSMLWATPGWEHDFQQIWHSKGIEDPGSSNYAEFSSPELDRLQDSLRRTMDPKKRVEAVRRIGQILYEEQPYTFFAWRKVFRAYWNHVKGVEENPYFIRPLIRTFPFWVDR